MPEVLERPASTSPFKDPDFARQAVRKWNEERAGLVEDGRRFRELAIEQAKEPKDESRPVSQEVARQIALTEEQITRTRNELNAEPTAYCEHCKQGGKMPGNHRAALLRELRGLMEHLCRLHNIAQAPTSKVTVKPQRAAQQLPPPTPIVRTPQPVVSGPSEPEPNG